MHCNYKEVEYLGDKLRDEKYQHMSSSSCGENRKKQGTDYNTSNMAENFLELMKNMISSI